MRARGKHHTRPKPRRRHGGPLVALAMVGAVVFAAPAHADDAGDDLAAAQRRIQGAQQQIPSVENVARKVPRAERTAQQRIADAMLLMGVKDYDRAIDQLEQTVEKFPNHPTAYADGLNLLGEAYFEAGQYLSARRVFTTIIDAGDARFAPYRERAAIRLVDVALRTRDLDRLDELFAKIGTISSAQSGLAYAKGKGLLAKGRLGEAATSLANVAADSPYSHQAIYLQGVIAMKESAPPPPAEGEEKKLAPKGTFARAVQLFQQVTQMAPDTEDHRHVIDLSWIAVGRLLYESRQWSEAVSAYNRIDRASPEFGTMLYELAWVYVQLGDVVRAQRALEVLAVAAPNSEDVADASLLRGDLLLRSGQFDKSKKVYENVRGTYEEMNERLGEFLGGTDDPGVFFDTLSQDQLELFEAGRALPPLVMKWAREGEDGERAFAIIDDVTTCRRLIKESNAMIGRLNAVLTSPNRIRAVPGLQGAAEKGLGLVNAIAMARVDLAHGMDETSDDLQPDLAGVRAQRQRLERRLGMVPVTKADFEARERQATRQWNKASQALQRLELEVDQLQAVVNGLERMLEDGPQAGVVRNPQQVQGLEQQLAEQRALIRKYREDIEGLRNQVEAGKVQVGFGDNRFVEDAQVRRQYAQLLRQEVQLAKAGRGGSDLARFAARVEPVLGQADQAEARIERALAEIDASVAGEVQGLREIVKRETANIAQYTVQLEALDDEARLVVGSVAMRNFNRVKTRLGDIVLRADVGITEQAWERREEQYTRVRRLKVERARTVQRLQEELDEVLDDGAAPEGE